MKRHIFLLFALTSAGFSVVAETVPCPALSTLAQVGACPSEEELRFTFDGYCSDNGRAYDKPEKQICTDFALYRAMKDVALWETSDGRFSGYVNCDPGKSGLAGAIPNGLRIDKQGSVTRMTCTYSSGVAFTYRSKAQCVAETVACASNPGACVATCE